jgi:hypothetical protein
MSDKVDKALDELYPKRQDTITRLSTGEIITLPGSMWDYIDTTAFEVPKVYIVLKNSPGDEAEGIGDS